MQSISQTFSAAFIPYQISLSYQKYMSIEIGFIFERKSFKLKFDRINFDRIINHPVDPGCN